MLADLKQVQQKEIEKSQTESTALTADTSQSSDSSMTAVQPPSNQSLSDAKSLDTLPLSAQPAEPSQPVVDSPVKTEAVSTSQLLPEEELSAALSAIVDSEDLSEPLASTPVVTASIAVTAPAHTLMSQTSIDSLAVASSPVSAAAHSDIVSTELNTDSSIPTVPPAPAEAPVAALSTGTEEVESAAAALSSSAQLPVCSPLVTSATVSNPVATTEPLQPVKTEKKTKPRKTKEKPTKTPKRKTSKPVVEVPVSGVPIMQPTNIPPGLHHGPPILPQQPMPAIASLPTSQQPIMFVQSQPGAPMILQQPPAMPSQSTITTPMMSSPVPSMSYQQAPAPAGMPPGLEPAMAASNGQQVRPIYLSFCNYK